jgi:hypothetical protein
MRTLLTGQQGTPALCPANRAFFLFFYFYFLAGVQKKQLYFLSVFSNNPHWNLGFLFFPDLIHPSLERLDSK